MKIELDLEQLNPAKLKYVGEFIAGWPVPPAGDEVDSACDHWDAPPPVPPAPPAPPPVPPAPPPVPPAPPAPPAPPPVPPAPPAPPAGEDVDSTGAHWDASVHAASRAKTASGEWRKRRGGATQEPELTRPETGHPATTAGAATEPPAPAAPPTVADFVALVGRVAALRGKNHLTMEEVEAVCRENGVAAFPMLATNLAMIPVISDAIDKLTDCFNG